MTRAHLTLIAMLMLCFLAPTTLATPFDADTAFAEANDAFARAIERWESDQDASRAAMVEALATYNAIVEHGPATAAVFANAGNAALFLDRDADAILAFRRALRIDPTDRVAIAGLDAARARVGATVPRSTAASAVELGLVWRRWISGGTLTVAALVCWTLIWMNVGVRSLGHVGGLRRLPFLVAGGACAAAALAEQVLVHNTQAGVVIVEATGYQGPSTAVFEPTFDAPLPAGTEVTRREVRDGWWRVKLADGTETWIAGNAAELVHGGG